MDSMETIITAYGLWIYMVGPQQNHYRYFFPAIYKPPYFCRCSPGFSVSDPMIFPFSQLFSQETDDPELRPDAWDCDLFHPVADVDGSQKIHQKKSGSDPRNCGETACWFRIWHTWGRGWMTKASGVGERRKGRGELRRDCHHRVAALFVPTRMQQWYMIYDI